MRLPSHPGLVLARIVAAAALAVVAVSAAHGQPPFYSAAEIRGWVVDAQTKQPIEGVYVVAQWILQTGLLEGRHVTRLHIMETMTDVKGEYYFPPWGPKPRPFLSELDSSDPRLTYFRSGYRLLDRSNQTPSQEAIRTSRWNGKTIELTPFRGGTEQWAEELRFLQSDLGWGDPEEGPLKRVNDDWNYMPRVVLEIWNHRNLLPERLRYRLRDLDLWGVTESRLRALLVERGSLR